MDAIIHGIASVLLYIFIGGVFIILANTKALNKSKKLNYSLALAFAMALIYAFFNKFNSFPELYGSDRLNYKMDYYGRLTSFSGFDLYLRFIHYLSNGNFEFLLYFTTFLSCFIVFFAYSYSKLYSLYALFFFLSTNYIIFSFTGLKQSLAMMFSNVVFLLVLSAEKKKYYSIICWSLIFLACYCHVVGYLLIPIYLLLKIDYINGKKYILLAGLLVLSIIFMKQILLGIASVTQSIVPNLSNKMIEYLGEDSIHITDGRLSALKGFSYYVIVFFLLKNKSRYSALIPNFSSLFVLGLLAAFTSFSSIVSYWFSRATLMLIFPVSLLFGQMIVYSKSKVERQSLLFLVLLPMLAFTLRSIVLTYVNFGGY